MSYNEDSFEKNISGVTDLVETPVNKVLSGQAVDDGVVGDFEDILELPMSDEELKALQKDWEGKIATYTPKIKPRQDKNKVYYQGTQKAQPGKVSVISSNLIFESEETFIPQALSQNPEPVVWSDNTPEGKEASNKIKTMLQYHADIFCLRKKLGVMVRQWSIYFIGVVKHGWDAKIGEIKTDLRRPQNFDLDPDGYIDEYGNFVGAFLREKIESSAQKLLDDFPELSKEKVAYIKEKVNDKLGTTVVRSQWWTDDYCFTTFAEEILEKHKNEFFNYDTNEKDEYGVDVPTKKENHFANPKMPYTFLSVFSLQETPHDITNLIEQNIANQDRINDRDDQISKNLRTSNNSIVFNGLHYNQETGRQAAQAMEDGDPVMDPGGAPSEAVARFPAPSIPDSVFKAQQNDKDTLRSVFGTQGLAAQSQDENQTARGMILNQSHDSSRIGGGIGDALEQVADNIFNWWLQLYYIFYDKAHYGAVMGNGSAVQYVELMMANETRKFVVSVAPNSMQPKDEITQRQEAVDLWNAKALDPIGLFEALDDPDPVNTAKRVSLWLTNPQMYMLTYFPEQTTQQPQTGQIQGGAPVAEGTPPPTTGQPPANADISQVPLPK